MVDAIYERPMEEDSAAFWACIRRAWPDAMTDNEHYEEAIVAFSAFYFAGTETTVNAMCASSPCLA